jgi:hypothetical protein
MGVYKMTYDAVTNNPLYNDLGPSNLLYHVKNLRKNQQIAAHLEQKGREIAKARVAEAAAAAKEEKKAEKQKQDAEPMYHGVSRGTYKEAFVYDVKLMLHGRGPMSKQRAEAQVELKYPGINITGPRPSCAPALRRERETAQRREDPGVRRLCRDIGAVLVVLDMH